MNKRIFYGLVAILLIGALSFTGFTIFKKNSDKDEVSKNKFDKVYVAAEGSGEVDVISTSSHTVIKKISLNLKENDSETMYMAHNVQVAPDGKSVWVTANAMQANHDDSHSFLQQIFPKAYAEVATNSSDQVIIIDPLKDEIVKRISLGENLHLAHVAHTPNGQYAVVAAQEKGEIYKINTTSYKVTETVKTQPGAQPHGLRIAPNGKDAYIAMLEGKSIGKLDLQSLTLTYIPLNGKPVQTGVTPDGKYIAASVFDKKSIALYSVDEQKLTYLDLPADAKGPLQLYPTPDSSFVYVADQGNYFEQPNGNKLYRIDIRKARIDQTITVGTAPHGVVVSPDGKLTYVTNLVSNDVSVVDNATGKEITTINTGDMPNGISYWSAQ